MASRPSRDIPGGVDLSGHARKQWYDRMPDDAVEPWQALVNAIEIAGLEHHPHFTDRPGSSPDTVYGYRGVTASGSTYTAVFLLVDDGRGPTIVTTYPPRPSDIRGRVADAVDDAGGPVDEAASSTLTNSADLHTHE